VVADAILRAQWSLRKGKIPEINLIAGLGWDQLVLFSPFLQHAFFLQHPHPSSLSLTPLEFICSAMDAHGDHFDLVCSSSPRLSSERRCGQKK
jgi:hypothetical protein